MGYDACYLAGLKNFPAPGEPHRPVKVLYTLAYREHALKPTFVVDTSAAFERKLEAIRCYSSQFDGVKALGELYARGIPLLDESAKTAEDEQTETVYRHARDFAARLGEVPVLVVPCLEGRLAEDAPLVEATTYYGSIYPAVWSFQLALRSRGLGSVFTTMHLAFETEARALLELPDDVVQTAMLPVAYTVGTDFAPTRRPEPETITYFNEWRR